MAEVFDPYYIWLGIPPEEQPADHYRLLGVRRFENHDEVIANAADQRVRHLRSMQTGKRQAETQKLLNEISAASGTLLNPGKRKEYDARLKAQDVARQPPPQPAPVIPVATVAMVRPVPLAPPSPQPLPAVAPSIPMQPLVGASSRGGRRQQSGFPLVAILAVGAIGLAVLGVGIMAGGLALIGIKPGSQVAGTHRPDKTKHPEKTSPPSTSPALGTSGGNGQSTANSVAPDSSPKTSHPAVPIPSANGGEATPNGSPIAAPRWIDDYSFEGQQPKSLLRGGTNRYVSGAEMPPLTTPFLTLAVAPQNSEGKHGVGFDLNNPPTSYTLNVLLDNVEGDGMAIDFPVLGRIARMVIDQVQNVDGQKVYLSGLDLIGGKRLAERSDETVMRGQVLTGRGPYSVTISVAMNRVCAFVTLAKERKYFCDFESDPRKLGLSTGYSGFGLNRIGITTRGKLAIHDVMLIAQVKKRGIAATSPESGQTLSVQLGKPVDVLREARPVKAESAVLRNGQLFTSIRPGWVAMMVFDHALRGEYLLDATVTRTSGKDGIQFAITVDNRPCTIALDCFVEEGRGAHSGLEVINGQRLIQPNYPALHKGDVLQNGKSSRVQIAVRKGNVVLQVDGKVLVDWKGDSRQLSRMPVTLSEAGPNVAIGTWMSTYTIESLRIYPILGNGTELTTTKPELPETPSSGTSEVKPQNSLSPPKTVEKRSPVPSETDLAKAQKEVQETFADQLAKGKKPDEKLVLAKELLTVADSEKDRAVRYALLDLARNLATVGQDFAAAVSIAESMAEQYDVDESQLKLETLKLTGGTTLSTSAWEAAAKLAAELATEAQEKGRLELADAASQLAMEQAGHSKNVEFRKGIKQVRDQIATKLKLWEVVKAGEKTLEAKPDDPAANLTVGKWRCFYLGEWKQGLPLLAKGSDVKLAKAAAAEKGEQTSEAADGWSAAAGGLVGEEKLAAHKHALKLFQEAHASVTGLEQLRIAKRIADLTELVAQSESQTPAAGGLSPRSKVATDSLRPGLLVRVYAAQPPKAPTPAIGVIASYADFSRQRKDLARELGYSPQRLTFAGIGYIDLNREESLSFHARNCIIFVDGNRLIANSLSAPVTTGPNSKNTNPDLIRQSVKPGRHILQVIAFDATLDGPDFGVTRDNGSSVISYSPADLEAELDRAVAFRGTSAKGKFMLGNR